MSKNKTPFNYELHYESNKEFYENMTTNVDLRNGVIVRGKYFGEIIKSHQVDNVAHLKINGVEMTVYTGSSDIPQDKLTKPRIIAGAHRANFLDNNSKVVSPLLRKVSLTEFEKDFPGFSRLLGCGFHFQRSFIATHFSNDKYGLENSELADVLAYVGCATLDYAAFLSSKEAAKFKRINDVWSFLTFLNKLPEKDQQPLKQSLVALSRQMWDIKMVYSNHVSVIHQMCSKIQSYVVELLKLAELLFDNVLEFSGSESDSD